MIQIFCELDYISAYNEDLTYESSINSTLYERLIYDSNDDKYSLLSLKITSELNQGGFLELEASYDSAFSKLYPPKIEVLANRDNIETLKNLSDGCIFYVYQNNKLIWKGPLVSREVDFYGNQRVVARDEFYVFQNLIVDLSFIKKKIVDNKITVKDFFESIFVDSLYNSSRNWLIGSPDIPRAFTFSYNISSDIKNEKINIIIDDEDLEIHYVGDVLNDYLFSNFGGYIVIERKNQITFFNYVSGENLNKNNSQLIDSSNVLDLKIRTFSPDYNGVYAVGVSEIYGNKYKNKLRDTNSSAGYWGVDFAEIRTFDQSEFRIDKYEDGKTGVERYSLENYSDKKILGIELEMNVVDLSLINENLTPIKEGELIYAKLERFNIDNYILCAKIEKDLLNPGNSKYYIGGSGGNRISNVNEKANKKFDYTISYTSTNISRINKAISNLGG